MYEICALYNASSHYARGSLYPSLISANSQCKEYCQKIVQQAGTVSNSNLVSSLFPITIGRKRPLPVETSKFFHSDLVSAENLPPPILESLSQQLRSPVPRLSSLFRTDRAPLATDTPTTTFIRDVGWATQLANGALKVQFNDGCQLVLLYDSSTIERIHWWPSSADPALPMSVFRREDLLPDEVHGKIELVPLFVQQLRSRCSLRPPGSP